jgi:hypothetical protein
MKRMQRMQRRKSDSRGVVYIWNPGSCISQHYPLIQLCGMNWESLLRDLILLELELIIYGRHVIL